MSSLLTVISLLSGRTAVSCQKTVHTKILTPSFAQYFLFYIGIALSTGISASIIAGTLTFFQLGIAHFRYTDDRLKARTLLCALTGFGTIALYQVHRAGGANDGGFGAGELVLLAAMFFAALGNVMNRESRASGWSPLRLTGFQMTVGGLMLSAVSMAGTGHQWPVLSVEFIYVLAYLSFVSAASFLLWNSLMTFNQASSVSMYLFLVPVFGVLLSEAVLHEPFDAGVFPVLIVVAAGIVIAQRAPRPQVDP